MMLETGYREFHRQHPYMITVDGDAKYHISYFFVRPWWGNLEWGCNHKRILDPGDFDCRCPATCKQAGKCNKCKLLPFASARPINIQCVGNQPTPYCG